jgi:copper(I)-binding protein
MLACSPPEQGPAEIAVNNGWAREMAPGQSAAAVYLTIVNKGAGSDRLVKVTAAGADATLHSSSSAGGVARMRPLEDGLEVAPRSTVALKPGGTHIMLTGLKQPLRSGQSIDLTLGFARSGNRPIAVRIVPATGENEHSAHGMRM